MFNKDKISENYQKPHIIVQYLFIERAENQIKIINNDQGYQMGYFTINISGKFKNDNPLAFKKQVLDELNYSVKCHEFFKSKSISLEEYKFGLVDNDGKVREFKDMDEVFFAALTHSLRNLMIVGNNFNIKKFTKHEIFYDWFENYSNKV